MINKAIIIGNLGANPEQRQTQNGNVVTNFNVGTSRKWKGVDGLQQEETKWQRIVTFSRLAEI